MITTLFGAIGVFVLLWLPLLLPAILRVVALFHGRPHPPGHCTRCGYDLAGIPRAACPECGYFEELPVSASAPSNRA